MNKITLFISMCMAALIAAGTTARADTEFTYQGELKDNGGLANGSFNMSFSLWDARAGGNQLDQTTPLGGVQVVEGKFSVELDFGASEFDNSNRWLEISINGFNLSPRNPITRSPYAIQTRGIFVDENENVGINTLSPGYLLEVNGSAGKPGGGSWSNSSDRRLKKNIASLQDSLDKLMQLRGVTYEYIDPRSINELAGQRIGVIAQEVESVFPDWVDQRSDGYKAVTFRGFEALTVEALRELRAENDSEIKSLRAEKDVEITSLRAEKDAEISELRAANEELQQRFARLESLVSRLTTETN